MAWVDEAVLADVRRLYGQPRELRIELEISRTERDLVVVQHHLAAVGPNDAGDHVKRGRLAGAVRPQQTHDLALVDQIAPIIAHPRRLERALATWKPDSARSGG